jgi:hypothetical protein
MLLVFSWRGNQALDLGNTPSRVDPVYYFVAQEAQIQCSVELPQDMIFRNPPSQIDRLNPKLRLLLIYAHHRRRYYRPSGLSATAFAL